MSPYGWSQRERSCDLNVVTFDQGQLATNGLHFSRKAPPVEAAERCVSPSGFISEVYGEDCVSPPHTVWHRLSRRAMAGTGDFQWSGNDLSAVPSKFLSTPLQGTGI